MILLFYFSKNRVNNIENKIYSGLLTTNVIGLIIDIIGYFTMNYLSSGYWWLAFYPGMSLLIVVLLFDFIGENVEKLLNPETAQE